MFVRAVPRVNHRSFQTLRQKVGRSCRSMPNHNRPRLQRLQVPCRVFEGFSFANTTRFPVQTNHIRTQSYRRQFKRNPRPRTWFNKKIHHRPSLQSRHFFNRSPQYFLKNCRRRENLTNLLRAQFTQRKKILPLPSHTHPEPFSKITASSPSTSINRTRTFSCAAVGRFFPM